MAFKLDKHEKARREELVKGLSEAQSKLEDELSAYNEAMVTLREPLEAALATYNEAVEAANGFAEDIASRADDEIGDKSEKWLESEKGEAAVSWKCDWEGAIFEEISIEFPDEITLEDAAHASTLEELPEQSDA